MICPDCNGVGSINGVTRCLKCNGLGKINLPKKEYEKEYEKDLIASMHEAQLLQAEKQKNMKNVIIAQGHSTLSFAKEVDACLREGYERVGNMVVTRAVNGDIFFYQQMELKYRLFMK